MFLLASLYQFALAGSGLAVKAAGGMVQSKFSVTKFFSNESHYTSLSQNPAVTCVLGGP